MHTKRVTIKDIATEAGVSIALVSFVMNNKANGKETYRVNKETAQRILEVARNLNYQPNNAARALRSGKTRTIGVIVSDISNKFFADIARCIENHAYTYNYTVLFGSTDENPQKLENLVEVFRNKGIDGLVVVPCEGADGIIRDIARQNIPFVLLDREVPNLEANSVVLNNCHAGYETTEVLIRRGFTRIEMISYSMRLSNICEREEGYRRSMKANGMGGKAVIHHLRHDKLAKIEDIVREARQRRVEAFLFATNTLAGQGLNAIFRNGWRVPQDFAIACFDTNEAFDIYKTTIACVRQPIEQFGIKALDLLIKSIEQGDKPGSYTRILLTPEIVKSIPEEEPRCAKETVAEG